MLSCLRRSSAPQEEKALGRPPLFLAFRSSTPFIALTVGLGVLVDLAGYSIAVPVVPFRLEELGMPDVASRTGWLIAAYAAGLIIGAPPMAYIGSRIKSRRVPLIFALLFMAGSIILFMETTSYTALVVSRVLTGISGSAVWTLGLALITDSVPENRVGTVMGWVMIGFSVGELIGPPVGGVMYERLGYRAPFIFILCLVFADMVLRIIVIEKATAIKYIEAGLVEIPNFEAIDWPRKSVEEGEVKATAETSKPVRSTWIALLDLLTSMRPLTLYLLVFLNGFVIGGLIDSGMTLWLEEYYNLSPLGAGLIFIALVAPVGPISPIAGWLSDRYGSKTACFGVAASIPMYPLMIIRGPLPLFVFFVALVGSTVAFFLSPIMADLNRVTAETEGLPSTFAYAGFIIAFSIGSFVGPIITGQVMEALGTAKGWMAMTIITSALTLLLLPLAVIYVGGPLRGGRLQARPTTVKQEVTDEEQQS